MEVGGVQQEAAKTVPTVRFWIITQVPHIPNATSRFDEISPSLALSELPTTVISDQYGSKRLNNDSNPATTEQATASNYNNP